MSDSAEDLPATLGGRIRNGLVAFARHRGCLPPGLSLKKNKIPVRYYGAFQSMSSDMEEIWVARVLHVSVKTETHQA